MADPGSSVEDDRVTVVVASRNRRADLLATLGRHRARVVLVDNGSSDGTVEAVRDAYPHVEALPLGRNLAAAGRTIGARLARTPFVAFADDDSWWAPGALRAAADVLAAHPRLGLVAVDVLVGTGHRPDGFAAVLRSSPLPAGPEPLPGPRVLGFMACAAIVRREAFLAVGGFDDVVRFPGEEERVAWDLTAAGRPLVHVSGPVVHHVPSAHRSDPAVRTRAIARSRVLTAVLRLPWDRVLDRVREEASTPAGRRGVRDALQDLPDALRARRVLPAHVLADLDRLAAAPADDGAEEELGAR